MLVYYNGNYVDNSKVAISPYDRGFLFADGVYEVIRAYRGRLFKSLDHLDRLAFGLKELRISGLDARALEPVALRLLRENKLEDGDALVYLQVTRGAAPRTHHFPPPETAPTIYATAKPCSSPIEQQQKGAAAIIVPDQRWTRCDLKTISLLPNTLAHQQAFEAGAFEAIFSRDGVLQEGTHSSILFVKDCVLVCPPLTNHLLPSITRKVVKSAASAESIRTTTRLCYESEIYDFDEVLMVGTAVEIVPLTSINGRSIAKGTPGPIAKRLQASFQKLVNLTIKRRPR